MTIHQRGRKNEIEQQLQALLRGEQITPPAIAPTAPTRSYQPAATNSINPLHELRTIGLIVALLVGLIVILYLNKSTLQLDQLGERLMQLLHVSLPS